MGAPSKMLLLVVILFTSSSAYDFCHTSECQTERRQTWLMKSLQHRATYYENIVKNSTCSPCDLDGFTQCYNNGTCRVTGPQTYECDCPDNTAGKFCETILSCDNENPCGTNAECIVYNHKKFCQCPPGYTGNANVSCTLRTKIATLYYDPTYTTFDGMTFTYDGTCPYYLMKPCNNSSVDFSIRSTNMLSPGSLSNSWIKNLIFNTQGYEIKVDENMLVYVDGYVKPNSFHLPSNVSLADATIIVTKPSTTITITDTITQAIISVTIVLTGGRSFITVQVPLTPFFYGLNAMCGLFGNIDDVCNNDIRAQNGTILTVSSCSVPTNSTVKAYQDTWVSNSTVDYCIEGQVISNFTSCNITSAQQKCDLIRQGIDGKGPFGDCQAMGHDRIDKFYHDCTLAMCRNGAICDSLDVFAKLCLTYVPFADIDDWRTPNFCPYTCPPDSHFSMKTPSCQDSCADQHYSNSSTCQEAYNEGCICNPGYFYDANGLLEGFPFVCRPLSQCGCVDNNDNYYPPDTHWLDVNCSTAFTCYDGQLTVEPVACSTNGMCSNIRGHPVCECSPGYSGNGFNCSDINECLDPAECSANVNQGICTNLPGTYNCTCIAPFSGPQCTEYTPSRHCADLLLFHGLNQSGIYSISIGADYTNGVTNDQLNWTEVYCDMDDVGGGWTLMAHGNNTGGKTFTDYVSGFGTDQNVWLGLENINSMTQSAATSLRVIIESCPQDNTPTVDCTYESFAVTDAAQQYAVLINSTCQSNLNDSSNIREGWITWDRTQLGPAFQAFDTSDPFNCSGSFYNTGWWYNGNRCGHANLNGLHFNCGDDIYDASGQYLTWQNLPVKEAHMFLRPKAFPFYDSHYNQ